MADKVLDGRRIFFSLNSNTYICYIHLVPPISKASALDMREKPLDDSTIGSMCCPFDINILQLVYLNNRYLLLWMTPRLLSLTILNQPSFTGCLMSSWKNVPNIGSHMWATRFTVIISTKRMRWLENFLDLMHIYEDLDPVFVKHGVKVGAARWFVNEIGFWVKRCRYIY